jgi:site-specific DNA-cytosine methylase
MKKLLVLVGCEESQEVCKAFRARGHEAYSCDIQECSGGHPEWHIQGDIFDAIESRKWDMLIAFPPCQKLSKAGAANWKRPGWKEKQMDAMKFAHALMYCEEIECIAIENPVGKLNTSVRKPDQRIQPWHFGNPYTKETCLWLKNLPPLVATDIVTPIANWVKPGNKRNRRFNDVKEGAGGDVKVRSKTFPGIARAMAEQWG